MDLSNFSGRDGIILAVIAIAVYLLVSLLRLSQIKRRRKTVDAARTRVAESNATDATNAKDAAKTAAAPQAGFAAAAPSFEEHLFLTNVETELRQLRQEVAELREALDQLTAARRVSPQYNEAMLLAQRGMNAQVIADQCAISIGEAELVAALSRNRQEYEDHDERH